MSKAYNNAGKTFVVDKIIQLKGIRAGSPDQIRQNVSTAINNAAIEDLKDRIEQIGSDGIITPNEKQSLKREWGNLESSYYKTQSQFQNDSDLNTSGYWQLLQTQFTQLNAIMQKVLSDMSSSYTESDVALLDDLFYDCWTNINMCSKVYESTLDFQSRYRITLTGSREFNKETTIYITILNITTNNYVSFPSSEFAFFRVSDNEKLAENMLSHKFVTADLKNETSAEFYCEWKHVETEGDSNNSTTVRMISFFTLSLKSIQQYQWSNAETESTLNKNDSAWSSVDYEQPENTNYKWVRYSEDDGSTWTYTRQTGLIGPQGWSSKQLILYKKAAETPENYDGEDLQYTFSTNTLTGNTGTWNKTIPSGSGDVYAIYNSVLSKEDITAVNKDLWTTPALLSTEGSKGEDGLSVATIFIYIRSASAPALPTQNATFSFSSYIVSNIDSWSQNIPTGSNKCWISTATISSRTDSAVITPSMWSTPVIFAENGVGIEKIEIEYGISNSATVAPGDNEWSPDRPERKEGEFLWTRQKITYTDGRVEYIGIKTDTGDKGDTSSNSTKMQYAWGISSKLPPIAPFHIILNSFIIIDGEFLTSSSFWSESKQPKPDTDHVWYLWVRWSYDNGATWTYPLCIPEESISVSISGPTSYNAVRNYVTTAQTLEYTVVRNNLDENIECTWTIDSAAVQGGIVFSNGTGEITGNTVSVTIPVGCMIQLFLITARCLTYESSIKPVMVSVENGREYLGVYEYDSTQASYPTTTRDGKPLRTGDSITVIDSLNNTNDIYMYVATTPPVWTNDIDDPLFNGMKMKIVMDSLWEMLALAEQGNQPVNQGAAWVFFRRGAFVDVFAENVFARTIELLGVIFGGGFNAEGQNPNNKPGFHISAITGLIQAFGAILNQIKIASTDYQNKTVFETHQAIEEGTYSFTGKTPTCFRRKDISVSSDIIVNGVSCDISTTAKYEYQGISYYGCKVAEKYGFVGDRTLTYVAQNTHTFLFITTTIKASSSYKIWINDVLVKEGSFYHSKPDYTSETILLYTQQLNKNDEIKFYIEYTNYIQLGICADGYNAFGEVSASGQHPLWAFVTNNFTYKDIIGWSTSDYIIKGSAEITVDGEAPDVIYSRTETGILSDIQENFINGETYNFDITESSMTLGSSSYTPSSLVVADVAIITMLDGSTITIDDNHLAYGLDLKILGEITRVVAHRIVIDDDEGSIGTAADPIPNLYADRVNFQSVLIQKGEGTKTIEYVINGTTTQIKDFYEQYSTVFSSYTRVSIKGTQSDVYYARMWKELGNPSTRWFLGLYDKTYKLLSAESLGFELITATGNDPFTYHNATLGAFHDPRFDPEAQAYYVSGGFTLVQEKVDTKLLLDVPIAPTSEEISAFEKGQVYAEANGNIKVKTD